MKSRERDELVRDEGEERPNADKEYKKVRTSL